MAHKKAGGSTTNGRNSPGQRLGIKRFAGQKVNAGEILVRQNGTTFHPGLNVGLARNHSLHALVDGHVAFSCLTRKKKKVSVIPAAAQA